MTDFMYTVDGYESLIRLSEKPEFCKNMASLCKFVQIDNNGKLCCFFTKDEIVKSGSYKRVSFAVDNNCPIKETLYDKED